MADEADRIPRDRSEDPRAQRSRSALRAALVDLLGAGSIEKVTVQALTAKAGVGYATFFRNYPDIDALLGEIADDAIGDLALLLRDFPTRRPIDIARAIATFVARNRAMLTPLFVGASAALERRIIVEATRAATTSRGTSAQDIPDALAFAHIVRASLTVMQWWLGDGRVATQETAARMIERLAFAPVLGRSD